MISVRPATFDDTQAISALFRARITTWQRMDSAGRVQDVPYDALTIYERWLHGGPWMSVETAALHLSHLLRGAGIPVVAESAGKIIGYAEAYHGVEPEPFGDHLHIAQMIIADAGETEDALLTHLLETARDSKCERLTAVGLPNDTHSQALYARHGLTSITRISRYNLPARSGQGFYKTVDHLNANAAQIADWYMPVGRFGSARQQWETRWPRTFHAVPEIRHHRAHRLQFSASGQEALIYCQQDLYNPRSAEIELWSPKPLTSQLLTALRDWTHREGYRTLIMSVMDAKILGPEAEPDGYYQDIYAVDL